MREYLGEQLLTSIVAPGRAAYLFPRGDAAAFERAIRTASSRWAGVTEPIVSVDVDGGLPDAFAQIVELADVAGLVNVGCSDRAAQRAAEQLSLDVVELDWLDRGPLLMHSIPWHITAPAKGEAVAARPDGPLWEKVSAGLVSDDGRQLWSAPTEDNAGRAALRSATLLDAGLASFAECSAVNLSSGPFLLWVTEPDSLDDCVDFWNMRALRPLRFGESPAILLPRRAFDDWVGLVEDLRGRLRSRAFSGNPDVIINSHSIPSESLHQIAEMIGLERDESRKLSFGRDHGDPIDEKTLSRPLNYMEAVDPRLWLAFPRVMGYAEDFRLNVFRQGTAVPIFPESLRGVADTNGVPLIRLRLKGGFLDELPRVKSVATAVHGNAVWSGDLLQVLVGIWPKATINIDSPSQDDVLDLLTRDLGVHLTPSDKGRIAGALRTSRSTAILEETVVLEAIKALTTARSKGLVKALDGLDLGPSTAQIVDLVAGLGGRVSRSYRPARELGVPNMGVRVAAEVLERLASAGWVERGFKIECGQCAMSYFTGLRDLSEDVSCPGCGALASLATSTSGVETFYRLDAFVDRCSDQGVIAHAAVASVLSRESPFMGLHLGADIALGEGDQQEVDLLGFLGKTVVAGEVKTSPQEFTHKQVERDVALSKRLGVDAHIMASTRPIEAALVAHTYQLCAAVGLELHVVSPGESGRLELSRHRTEL